MSLSSVLFGSATSFGAQNRRRRGIGGRNTEGSSSPGGSRPVSLGGISSEVPPPSHQFSVLSERDAVMSETSSSAPHSPIEGGREFSSIDSEVAAAVREETQRSAKEQQMSIGDVTQLGTETGPLNLWFRDNITQHAHRVLIVSSARMREFTHAVVTLILAIIGLVLYQEQADIAFVVVAGARAVITGLLALQGQAAPANASILIYAISYAVVSLVAARTSLSHTDSCYDRSEPNVGDYCAAYFEAVDFFISMGISLVSPFPPIIVILLCFIQAIGYFIMAKMQTELVAAHYSAVVSFATIYPAYGIALHSLKLRFTAGLLSASSAHATLLRLLGDVNERLPHLADEPVLHRLLRQPPPAVVRHADAHELSFVALFLLPANPFATRKKKHRGGNVPPAPVLSKLIQNEPRQESPTTSEYRTLARLIKSAATASLHHLGGPATCDVKREGYNLLMQINASSEYHKDPALAFRVLELTRAVMSAVPVAWLDETLPPTHAVLFDAVVLHSNGRADHTFVGPVHATPISVGAVFDDLAIAADRLECGSEAREMLMGLQTPLVVTQPFADSYSGQSLMIIPRRSAAEPMNLHDASTLQAPLMNNAATLSDSTGTPVGSGSNHQPVSLGSHSHSNSGNASSQKTLTLSETMLRSVQSKAAARGGIPLELGNNSLTGTKDKDDGPIISPANSGRPISGAASSAYQVGDEDPNHGGRPLLQSLWLVYHTAELLQKNCLGLHSFTSTTTDESFHSYRVQAYIKFHVHACAAYFVHLTIKVIAGITSAYSAQDTFVVVNAVFDIGSAVLAAVYLAFVVRRSAVKSWLTLGCIVLPACASTAMVVNVEAIRYRMASRATLLSLIMTAMLTMGHCMNPKKLSMVVGFGCWLPVFLTIVLRPDPLQQDSVVAAEACISVFITVWCGFFAFEAADGMKGDFLNNTVQNMLNSDRETLHAAATDVVRYLTPPSIAEPLESIPTTPAWIKFLHQQVAHDSVVVLGLRLPSVPTSQLASGAHNKIVKAMHATRDAINDVATRANAEMLSWSGDVVYCIVANEDAPSVSESVASACRRASSMWVSLAATLSEVLSGWEPVRASDAAASLVGSIACGGLRYAWCPTAKATIGVGSALDEAMDLLNLSRIVDHVGPTDARTLVGSGNAVLLLGTSTAAPAVLPEWAMRSMNGAAATTAAQPVPLQQLRFEVSSYASGNNTSSTSATHTRQRKQQLLRMRGDCAEENAPCCAFGLLPWQKSIRNRNRDDQNASIVVVTAETRSISV